MGGFQKEVLPAGKSSVP